MGQGYDVSDCDTVSHPASICVLSPWSPLANAIVAHTTIRPVLLRFPSADAHYLLAFTFDTTHCMLM